MPDRSSTPTLTPAELLQRYAPEAGLDPRLAPFPRAGTLAERLAANPFLMAPMAGVSDAAWRLMARAGGAALAYSEMVSVAGIHYGGEKTWELVVPHDPEPDLAVQLFGSDPAQFREASEQVARRLGTRLAALDVNMACPVPKVVRKGEGSALMEDPSRAAAIVAACREGVEAATSALGIAPVPVTCKIRRGYHTGEELAPAFAQVLEEAGAEAVAVHGRFADQLYRGQADWGVLARVGEAVRIPVIASGDVATPEAAARILAETGAQAAMIARGTYGNPWIFRDAQALAAPHALPSSAGAPYALPIGAGAPRVIPIGAGAPRVIPSGVSEANGAEGSPAAPADPRPEPPAVSADSSSAHPFDQRIAAFKLHVRLMDAVGTHIARARSLAGWYFRGIPDASHWRDVAMHAATLDDFLTLADHISHIL